MPIDLPPARNDPLPTATGDSRDDPPETRIPLTVAGTSKMEVSTDTMLELEVQASQLKDIKISAFWCARPKL
jgi:hypothetical protein